MENEKNKENVKNEKSKDYWFTFFIIQCVYTVIIIISVLIIKFFFSATYTEVKNWYRDNILTETTVNEVLDGFLEESNEI